MQSVRTTVRRVREKLFGKEVAEYLNWSDIHLIQVGDEELICINRTMED